MITFEEFDEAITNVAIDAVFPTKRDLYMKPVYSHDNKDDKIGMTYVIMPYESKNYYIGFIHEQSSSMFTMWNGKLNHIVFDVDERDGCIRYYHEPELYDRDHGLSHSQIQTIGEALIKYLTSNNEEKDDNEPDETKKKHPLQNSPTFPEEESVEEKQCAIIDDTVAVATEDKTWMKPGGKFDKPIDPFKMIPIFNTGALETNAPYIIKNLENNTMGIVTLRDCSSDYVVFGLWNDDGEYIVEEFTVSEFYGAFELYTTNNAKVEL